MVQRDAVCHSVVQRGAARYVCVCVCVCVWVGGCVRVWVCWWVCLYTFVRVWFSEYKEKQKENMLQVFRDE